METALATLSVQGLLQRREQYVEFRDSPREVFDFPRFKNLSSPLPNSPSPQSTSMLSKLVRFLKSHPKLFLLLLTPGIPEYLSASSQITLLVINPPLFFLLLAANIGLYGSGVILIREAMIRWKKGWASVFLLGVAYGIVEEGLALWTLFNPLAQPVGNLGFYGHWLGVNWVWTVGLLIFHSVYSIGLPIFLFGLVFPELKHKSLVTGAGITISVIGLTFDSIALFVLEYLIYRPYNQEQKVAFGVGLIFPIVVFGIIASIGLGNVLIVVADLFFVLFSRRLWRKWHQWTPINSSAIQTGLPGFGESPAPRFP